MTEQSAVIDVVKKANPAVVSIVISKDLSKVPGFGVDPFGGDPFFQFFGFNRQTPRSNPTPNVQKIGAGSGFLVSPDGLVLTNRHVVEDEGASYTVLTNDRKKYEAKVLTRDPVNDLAILKIEITNAPVLELADSAQIQIGQRVIAIGNSLGQYDNTVTTGVVSAINRSVTAGGESGAAEQLEGVIQTDAAINPGNSGGPLLNVLGQVIGINTAIDQGGQLVGFAIPANDISRALDSFKKTGKITRPYIGVRYVLITPELAESQKLPKDYGALIARGETFTDVAVIPGSPADKAGLVENDIILAVDGTRVDEEHSLSGLLRNHQVGDVVSLRVYHKGEEKAVTVTLSESK
ncbi:MAG: trypsin-like peptidase domain-containing protein [Candidatus Doudnabacteria bacterium]|nr:trypsin-like peptidase domain-containing protein [Candidatus Doudnabacteria bacterium]